MAIQATTGPVWRAWQMLIFTLLLALAQVTVAEEAWTQVPVPEWVDWAQPSTSDALAGDGGGRIAVLLDDQVSLMDGTPRRFYRRVHRVLTASGVEAAGDYSVSFDPSFERVSLHGVWIERDGRREDRLRKARIETLRREGGLESGLLNGRLTLHVVLDDVRVGDVVDFAVSVDGDNPALGRAYRGAWQFDVGIPTSRYRVRLLVPEGRDIQARIHGEAIEATDEASSGGRARQWELHDLLPQADEEGVPAWHSSQPRLEIADAMQWRDVVAWALPLYASAGDAQIASIATETGLMRGDASEDAVLRAIAFVQDEIRYTGLELGAQAYRPYAPDEVVRRRYGDCKDKAMLLVGLLRYLGLDAAPALVDTDYREHLVQLLPSPRVFDHAIVWFEHEGADYWVDATVNHQRGRLDRFNQAEFGRALLIRRGETGLREMAKAARSEPAMDIEENIDLRDGEDGLSDVGDYRIRTVYRYGMADSARRNFASQGAEGVGRSYLDAVANYYPGAEQIEPPSMRDDAQANEVEVLEHYRLPGIWEADEDGGSGRTASFWLSEIDRAITRPKGATRRAPWRLARHDVRQRLRVELDGGWPKSREKTRVRSEFVDARREVSMEDSALLLEGHYKILADAVPAEHVATLRRDLDKAADGLGHTLTWDPEADASESVERIDWDDAFDVRMLAVLLPAVLFWAWVAWCGFSKSLSPALGMLFRVRACVRAAIDAGRVKLALGLFATTALLDKLLEDRVLKLWLDGQAGKAVAFLLAATVGMVLGYTAHAAFMAWFGRRFGGQGRFREVFIALGWAQVPVIAALAVLAAPLLFLAASDQQIPAWLMISMAISLPVAVLPALLWALVAYVKAVAEVHGIGIWRAVLTAALPVFLIGTLVAAVALLKT